MATVLLFSDQFGVLFLLSLATSLCSRATLSNLARLGLCLILGILTVDLEENVLDARIGIRVDEVAEEVSETE
jgi:hypothetical protein